MFSAEKTVKKICWLDRSLLHNSEVKEIIKYWQKDHDELQRQLDAQVKPTLAEKKCEFCGENIEQDEYEYIHKSGFGCCKKVDTEYEEREILDTGKCVNTDYRDPLE